MTQRSLTTRVVDTRRAPRTTARTTLVVKVRALPPPSPAIESIRARAAPKSTATLYARPTALQWRGAWHVAAAGACVPAHAAPWQTTTFVVTPVPRPVETAGCT